MTTSQKKLTKAMQYAMENKPKVGGFPFLAECLRQAGVTHNKWSLPSTQSIYIMEKESIVQVFKPLIEEMTSVPSFDKNALIKALKADQSGNSTFPEFLNASWQAGVTSYVVDFVKRTVSYYGVKGEIYTESYPKVEITGLKI